MPISLAQKLIFFLESRGSSLINVARVAKGEGGGGVAEQIFFFRKQQRERKNGTKILDYGNCEASRSQEKMAIIMSPKKNVATLSCKYKTYQEAGFFSPEECEGSILQIAQMRPCN